MSSQTETEGNRPATFFDRTGDRHYRHPNDYHRTWVGVSAVLGVKRLEFIERARRKAIATYAARHRADLAKKTRALDVVAELLDEGNTLPEWERKRAAGVEAHVVIDRLITGDHHARNIPLPADDPRVWAPKWWIEFARATGFRAIDSEQTVVSDRYGYGGSYDLYGQLPDGTRCLVDVKTNERGPKSDVALQLEFYHRADSILDTRTGAEVPMHPVDRHYVLWMRPDGWAWIPLMSGDQVWRYCYARLLTYFDHLADEVILDPEAGNLAVPRAFY